jgi:hypothetical protein
MELTTFVKHLEGLFVIFEKRKIPSQIAEYYKIFGSVDETVWERTCRRAKVECTYFPRPKELRALQREMTSPVRSNGKEWRIFTCPRCSYTMVFDPNDRKEGFSECPGVFYGKCDKYYSFDTMTANSDSVPVSNPSPT